MKYREYKKLDLPAFDKEILSYWEENEIFEKSLQESKSRKNFIFYEGPPSANGIPGIHHVMARTIKDIFCRYKTLKGYHVERKAGWDTHGLPVEIGVEKNLGITKDDIGKKISIEEYNNECRKDVMKYTDLWETLTRKMGYWIDMKNPYITYETKYIESVWYLLKEIYKKGLLYKGYTIQPYSPAAGTGLSTHELNQPGCYKMVKDYTVVAQFYLIKNEHKVAQEIYQKSHGQPCFLAWTTTPWTLPSNTALAVGKEIDYAVVNTFNQYTHKPITVVLAKALINKYFSENAKDIPLDTYKPGDKEIPWQIVAEYKGMDLAGCRYEQLLPYEQPKDGDAFVVVCGDFVSTEEGTGIVHIAPSFGADDFRTAKQYGLGSLTLVDKQGRFVESMGEFAGRYVKNEYDPNAKPDTRPVDVDIIIKLKEENKAFKTEKYEHSYPHCWRTDKPILYYPLDSWFIKTTAVKERMIELNKTIYWKPEHTGTGRFGNWLENLVDWNLSRSRFWGIPLPIWRTEDGKEEICIGSLEELMKEIEKSIEVGFMTENPYKDFVVGDFSDENYNKIDLHRPYIDKVILVSPTGKKMYREPDLIDVWFDSGSMPYAQFHYPFENKDKLNEFFPADFIAEGVDQTRGWFFTLHAISTMVFDSVSFKTVVSNGLVLDKNGNKMSKRLGNAIDPFETIDKYGADATRWYMITNAQPWDNLKFDIDGIVDVQKNFFNTLFNTYSFFALYANIDNFRYEEPEIPYNERPEIDRWILSELNTLIQKVDEYLSDYEPMHAGRAIEIFLDECLSNWYVRLCRRRFWKGEYSKDKISAFQTLYKCLETLAILASPIAPFYMEKLFLDLNSVTKRHNVPSVHMAKFPEYDVNCVDKELEEKMQLARKISSMILSLRKKVNIRVRQPLQKVIIPIINEDFKKKVESVKELILAEVNVKELEFIKDDSGLVIKKIKPNYKVIGPKYQKIVKLVAEEISKFDQSKIYEFEKNQGTEIKIGEQTIKLLPEDVEIYTEDIPGWLVANDGFYTVALDITITQPLKEEGIARELVNRIQNLRKSSNFDVTDKIVIEIGAHEEINSAIKNYMSYICSETLASKLELVDESNFVDSFHIIEIDENIKTKIKVSKN